MAPFDAKGRLKHQFDSSRLQAIAPPRMSPARNGLQSLLFSYSVHSLRDNSAVRQVFAIIVKVGEMGGPH